MENKNLTCFERLNSLATRKILISVNVLYEYVFMYSFSKLHVWWNSLIALLCLEYCTIATIYGHIQGRKINTKIVLIWGYCKQKHSIKIHPDLKFWNYIVRDIDMFAFFVCVCFLIVYNKRLQNEKIFSVHPEKFYFSSSTGPVEWKTYLKTKLIFMSSLSLTQEGDLECTQRKWIPYSTIFLCYEINLHGEFQIIHINAGQGKNFMSRKFYQRYATRYFENHLLEHNGKLDQWTNC